jgi:phosphocarrier protein HPr
MSASSELSIQLPTDVALHARPAALFVRTAMTFQSAVKIATGEREVDAKSLMAVLALGAEGGTMVTVRADGPDAADAITVLGDCLRTLR